MAKLGGSFNANNVDPAKPRDLLPPNDYPVQIVASEMKPTKTGNGEYLSLEMEVIDGEHKGAKIWENLNLNNPSAQTMEIAQRTLSAICHATGKMEIEDSVDLHFKTMIATIAIEVDSRDRALPATDPARRLQNRIKAYKPAPDGYRPDYTPAPRPNPTLPLGGTGGGGSYPGAGGGIAAGAQRQAGGKMPWQK